jgi:hypothetical protein
MDATGPSAAAAGRRHNDPWRKIEISLEAIQVHCNQLLSDYPRLSSQEVIDLIETIEIHSFLLQELLAQVAPSASLADNDEEGGYKPFKLWPGERGRRP